MIVLVRAHGKGIDDGVGIGVHPLLLFHAEPPTSRRPSILLRTLHTANQ
jgi:hypothetical protein